MLRRLRAARLYLICDERPDEFLQAALRGGVDVVQLRMKDSDEDRIVAAGRRFARLCATHDALFILNDRPDLVAACTADGVHVGQEDAQVAQARELLGPARLVGLSTHTPEQIEQANADSPDYIGVGPVYQTPTKPGQPAVGLALVGYAAQHARMPFFAIGGIDAGNMKAVRRAGARGVAVVRALTEASDPERVARHLRAPEGQPVGAA
jgi:thiamine-phosphate pyrophosphorylase